MANMFSGKSEKRIPRTLTECTQPDATASNLHLWAERLEKWGKILFWFLIAWGVINAVSTSIAEEIEYYGLHNDRISQTTSFDWNLFIVSLVQTGLSAFLEYCAYHVLALLVSALALITQNSIVSANVALYEAMGKGTANSNVSAPAESPAPTTPAFHKPVSTPAPAGMWECKFCGTHNSMISSQCKKCGKYKS